MTFEIDAKTACEHFAPYLSYDDLIPFVNTDKNKHPRFVKLLHFTYEALVDIKINDMWADDLADIRILSTPGCGTTNINVSTQSTSHVSITKTNSLSFSNRSFIRL